MATALTVGSAGGEYMEAVVVLEWHAEVGDVVKAGDILVTVETAKAAVEVEAPIDGILSSILAEVDTETAVTDFLGTIGISVDDKEVAKVPEADTQDAPTDATAATVHVPYEGERVSPQQAHKPDRKSARVIVSPAARIEAARRNISLEDITPTSPSGRIKLRDLVPPDTACSETQKRFHEPHRFRETGPLKVHSSDSADGVPLVMLHGFASDAQSWLPMERALASARPIYRIDLPNHGRSPKRTGGGFRALARDVVEAFDALELDRAHLVGHSLGGACALALADIRLKRVASLTLIAPGGLGPEINHAFLHGIARASRPESLEPWLKSMVGDERLIGRDFVGAAMASRTDARLRDAQRQMIDDVFPDGTPGFDLRSALERLICPTRIIWGKADTVLPWSGALSAPGTVGLHLFDRIGHMPQLEVQEDVLNILRAVMAEGEA